MLNHCNRDEIMGAKRKILSPENIRRIIVFLLIAVLACLFAAYVLYQTQRSTWSTGWVYVGMIVAANIINLLLLGKWNPECKTEIPDNLAYCNEGCLRRHMEIKRETRASSKSNNNELDPQLETKLTNTQWQRGLAWRQEKVETVAEVRRKGIEDKTIFRYLKRSGLTDQTARKIMDDARYWE